MSRLQVGDVVLTKNAWLSLYTREIKEIRNDALHEYAVLDSGTKCRLDCLRIATNEEVALGRRV